MIPIPIPCSLAGVHRTTQLPTTEPCVSYSAFWTILWVGDGLLPSAVAGKLIVLFLHHSPLIRQLSCMEHTLNLASKAFIEAICPAPSQYKKGKRKTNASKGVDSNGEDSDDDELEWLANLANKSPINADMEIDEDVNFDLEDLLGKVLALINQVFDPFYAAPLCDLSQCPDTCFATSKGLFCDYVPRRRFKTSRTDQMDSYSMGVYVRSHRPCPGEPRGAYPHSARCAAQLT